MADPLRILYVDDEPGLLTIGKLFLEKEGAFAVDTLTSAKLALEQLNLERYDAIISDFQMPDIDGIAFLKQLKASGNTTPFIIFTGKGREEVVIEALNNGADFYLQKGGEPKAQFAELSHKIKQSIYRKKAETDLAKSEANLQAIIANTDDIIASYDTDIRLLVYNRAASEIYRSIFEIELRPDLCTLDLFPESMRGFWNTNNERALAGESFSIKFNLHMPSGQERFFDSSYNPIFKDGVVVGFSTFTRDITERKRADDELYASYEQISAAEEELRGQFEMLLKSEKDLRESEARYRLISENTADVIWILDYKTGKFTYVSPSVQKLRGYSPDEVMSQTMADALTPESMEVVARLIQEGISERKSGDTSRHISTNLVDQACKDGSVVSTEVVSTLIFDEQGHLVEIIGISRDITERKMAEEALRESESHLSSIIRVAPIGIGVVSNRIIMKVNNRLCQMTGYTAEELIGKSSCLLYPTPEDYEYVGREKYAQIAQKGTGSVQTRWQKKDGTIIDILLSSTPVDPSDLSIGVTFTALDLTERKKAEETIRENEERFRTIINSMQFGIVIIDAQTHTMLEANPKALEMIGGTGELVLGSVCHRFICPAELGKCPVTDLSQTVDSSERVLLNLRGEKIPIVKSVIKTMLGGKEVLIESFIDITDRKVAEDTLLRVNKKLNVISQLTRKDLTSQTFVLSSYLELVKNQLAGQDHIIDTLEKGFEAVRTIQDTIEYSKNYQDMGATPPKWQNVNMTLLFGLSHISIGNIRNSIETGNLEIFADPLLEKVCQCLFENSVKHGEHVTHIRVWHTITPDGATIFFEDDGTGIPHEKKEQIFLRSEGTSASRGSLIFVREILDITGITIRETGEPGKGARFEIAVPKGMWRSFSS